MSVTARDAARALRTALSRGGDWGELFWERQDVVTLTPNAAGETMSFVFTVDYTDDRQPYHGSRSYVLTVMP